VDSGAGRVFWTELNNAVIRSAALDGTDVQIVIGDLQRPGYLALDAGAGKVYWTDDGGIDDADDAIKRVNYDGTGYQLLRSEDISTNFWGIAVDPASGTLYWTVDEFEATGIQRSDLNGNDVVDILVGPIRPRQIALLLCAPGDCDRDGTPDGSDNCPKISNADQSNL